MNKSILAFALVIAVSGAAFAQESAFDQNGASFDQKKDYPSRQKQNGFDDLVAQYKAAQTDKDRAATLDAIKKRSSKMPDADVPKDVRQLLKQ